mmetsp:Transcript_3317/g.4564  ORF Transcript_3317/g.4564 Transcript_3317/m.4564 type:complete len:258 (+) Transcript_3317:49-822(+)
MGDASKLFMRSPKFVVISKEMYDTKYWPSIKSVIDAVFFNPMKCSFSQEEAYRNVYNLCCQRHTQQLYDDLMKSVEDKIREVQQALNQVPPTEHMHYVHTIATSIVKFKKAAEILSGVFRYLERSYLLDKLNKPFTEVMLTIINCSVLNVREVQERTCAGLQNLVPDWYIIVAPTTMYTFVNHLYAFYPESKRYNMQLFDLYIPLLHPSKGYLEDLQETNDLMNYTKQALFGLANSNTPTFMPARPKKRSHNDMLTL